MHRIKYPAIVRSKSECFGLIKQHHALGLWCREWERENNGIADHEGGEYKLRFGEGL